MLVFSLLAVTSRRILRAAVYLLFSLAGTAAFYFMIDYFFLAAVQLIVYAGGIVVLIIFSILLTSHIADKLERPDMMKNAFSAVLVLGGIALTAFVLGNFADGAPSATNQLNMQIIGEKLMNYKENGYVLPFEVISILLLAAMVSAIVVAKRTKTKNDV
jgi:NADH-quinone oxidoreductase subunit J